MDMAVASLFKHKVGFRIINQTSNPIDSFPHYKRFNYRSVVINRGEKIGVNHTNEVFDKINPLLYYIFSNMHQYREEVAGLNNEWKATIKMYLIREKDHREFITDSWRYESDECEFRPLDGIGCWHGVHPKNLIYKKFSIHVKASFYFYIRPIMFEELGEYTLPIEPHREDCCVACLDKKPNILYLNCLHICICDSCDRQKKIGRKKCDMCRAEIVMKVKI